MVIIIEKGTKEKVIEAIIKKLDDEGFDIHRSTGVDHTILGVIGNTNKLDIRDIKLIPRQRIGENMKILYFLFILFISEQCYSGSIYFIEAQPSTVMLNKRPYPIHVYRYDTVQKKLINQWTPQESIMINSIFG